LLFIGLSIIGKSQSVRLPSGDSITYDFSGATRKGSPGLYKYFTTSTSDDGRITRNVADFNRDSLGGKGWRGMINFQAEYNLDSIKFYDRSGSRDTIWIYTFDKDNAPKWDTICNPEDYTPDYVIISCGTCAGLPVTTKINATAGDKVQFAFIVMRRTNLFSGLWPDVSNISFYGSLTGQKDTTYNLAHWAFNDWTARPIDSIIGNFNLPNQQDTLWHDTATANGNYGNFRSFDQMFYDDEVSKHNYRFNLGGGGYTGYKYNAALARRGNYQFAVVFNDNAYYKFQLDSIHHSAEKSWGTNTIYDDPQLPASYSRKGQYMGFLAKHGGGSTTERYYPTYNGTMEYGKGYLKGLGTNNEPTLFAFANAFKNPIEETAETAGVVDSVALGDPAMPVFMGGYEAYNYDDAKAGIMLLKLYYRSRNIKIAGVAFHGIHTLKTDSFSVIPTTNQQIGNHGVSVGYWDDWRKNIHYVQALRREAGNTSLLVQLDEDTHQKGVYKRSPADAGETFSVSQLGTPRFTISGVTQDAYKSHAVAALQDEMIATASPLFKHYWYQIVDGTLSSVNPDYDAIDQNNGKFDKPLDFTDHPESWPADYATVSRKKRLGQYKFVDSVQTTSRGLHVFKYVHVGNPDSLMYEYAVLDSTGTASFTITGLNNTTGKIITPSFTSRTAGESTGTITAGSITLNADPLPRALIVYSPSEDNQAPTARAGNLQSITLPISSVMVSGNSSSDPDGTISTYLWTKTSGPSTYAITSPNNATTSITGLVAGTYVFTLTVTDDDGATDTDTVTVVVTPAIIITVKRHGRKRVINSP
jgi:hypothetical protein